MPLLKDKQAWIRCSAVEAIADLADQSSEAFDALPLVAHYETCSMQLQVGLSHDFAIVKVTS